MSIQLRQCQPCRLLPISQRFNSTTTSVKKQSKEKKGSGASNPPKPAYPYGPARLFKQSDSGLYGGSRVQYGHSRTEKKAKKNDHVSHKIWHPNVQKKRIWSDALAQFVPIKVQMRVLRTIDKVGGLDNYLMGNSPARIKELGMTGWRLRWRIMSTKAMLKRRGDERAALGLPREGYVLHEKGRLRRLQMRADRLAERYLRLEDERNAIAQMDNDDTQLAMAEQQLLEDSGDWVHLKAEHQDRLITEHQDRLQEEESEQNTQTEHGVTDAKSEDRITTRARELDALAVQIAADTRLASRSLPLPDLYSVFGHNQSLLSQLKALESGTLSRSPRELYRFLGRLAPLLSTTTDVLIASARSRLAEQDNERQQRSETRAAQDTSVTVDDVEQEGQADMVQDPHEEIDTAIAAGASTLLPLYDYYLEISQGLVEAKRNARKEQRLQLANRYLRQLRTKNHKGGKGIYIKKTAWDTCIKRATKQVEERPVIWNVPPEDLTLRQWQRLVKAGRTARREQREEDAEARRVELEEAEAGEPREKEPEGVRAWMSERELGVFDRIQAGLRARKDQLMMRVFGKA